MTKAVIKKQIALSFYEVSILSLAYLQILATEAENHEIELRTGLYPELRT